MNWNKISFGRRITLSFALLLFFLAAMGIVAHNGVENLIESNDLIARHHNVMTLLDEKEIEHLVWGSDVSEFIFNEESGGLTVTTDHRECRFGQWLASEERKHAEALIPELTSRLAALEAPHRQLHESALHIQNAVSAAETPAMGRRAAAAIYTTEMMPLLRTVRTNMEAIRQSVKEHNIEEEARNRGHQQAILKKVTAVGVLAIAIGMLMAFGITRSLTNLLRRFSGQLNDGAQQITAASVETAAGSQTLAEGSSQQAASVEEMAASLEEMSAMIRSNADNSKQANDLMNRAVEGVETAGVSMSELTEYMHRISQASEETFKIVKSIDEIAFQTNLLSLNAAVEAARAGESGAGFAVVAGEVRNLAARAAEAAKSTSSLIEETVKRVQKGVDLVHTTDDTFRTVSGSARDAGLLMNEITAASEEQANGIRQITIAVSELDKITQQNAATAEESAASAEELNAQAVQMSDMVLDLAVLSGLRTASAAQEPAEPRTARRQAKKPLPRLFEKSRPKLTQRNNGPGREVHPEEILPLGDAVLESF